MDPIEMVMTIMEKCHKYPYCDICPYWNNEKSVCRLYEEAKNNILINWRKEDKNVD